MKGLHVDPLYEFSRKDRVQWQIHWKLSLNSSMTLEHAVSIGNKVKCTPGVFKVRLL